jgi:pantoate--beta-alanine ligase
MILIHTIKELQREVLLQKKHNKIIGFVPTMGALHKGHLSLVNTAGQLSDFVIVSIFVNPTQFNDQTDLERYPRNLEADMDMLKQTACDVVFAPSVAEMYPQKDSRVFNFEKLGTVMEGKHRPGHFNGVAQIVSKLFDAATPDKAFFGEKDFQQLAIIKEMTRQLKYNIDIIACKTVREHDGLAMSSRNRHLNTEQRKSAAHISKTLFEAVKLKNDFSVDELKNWVINKINSDKNLETEYFDIIDSDTLQTISLWTEKVNKTGCIAVYCGKVRLIDNVTFE